MSLEKLMSLDSFDSNSTALMLSHQVRSDSLAVKVAQGVRQQLQQAPAAEAPRVAATEAAPSTSHEEAGQVGRSWRIAGPCRTLLSFCLLFDFMGELFFCLFF